MVTLTKGVSDSVMLGEGEEGPVGAEPEIDFEIDPFEPSPSAGPDQEWEDMIRSIKPRKPS